MALADLYTERWQEPAVEEEVLERPAWMRNSLCREFPDVSFFPERGESTTAAKAVCARCTVRDECLDFAMAIPQQHFGIWGGTSERERKRLRQRRAKERDVTELRYKITEGEDVALHCCHSLIDSLVLDEDEQQLVRRMRAVAAYLARKFAQRPSVLIEAYEILCMNGEDDPCTSDDDRLMMTGARVIITEARDVVGVSHVSEEQGLADELGG